jgi:hypothetical protein
MFASPDKQPSGSPAPLGKVQADSAAASKARPAKAVSRGDELVVMPVSYQIEINHHLKK